MPRCPSPPLINHSFLLSALAANKRLDGRAPLDIRDIRIEFGSELGSVECSFGKTRWVAGGCGGTDEWKLMIVLVMRVVSIAWRDL
jgi:exosome complex RNA-binding protein Rrp42 (RNase PH superfamily)